MSKLGEAATVAGVALGILVWVVLALVGLALPVLATVWLFQHI